MSERREWTAERTKHVRTLYEKAVPAWQGGAFGLMASVAVSHLPDALREIERLTDALACDKEAERALIEYAEIDVLDKTPERIRIARRIRALPLCAVPDEPFEVAPPVRHARHDRHCMIGDGVGCSREPGCEVER